MRVIKKLYYFMDTHACFVIISFSVALFIASLSYIKLYFNEDVYDKYVAYKNISVEIKYGRINGMLNKYISIKNRNNICYTPHCGFSQDGFYQLSSILFYEINEKYFVFKSCIDEDKYCFYNISDEFIKDLKEKCEMT